jgi:hypothetical protein
MITMSRGLRKAFLICPENTAIKIIFCIFSGCYQKTNIRICEKKRSVIRLGVGPPSFLGVSLFGEGLNTPIYTPKPLGFYPIPLDVIGQHKKKKA